MLVSTLPSVVHRQPRQYTLRRAGVISLVVHAAALTLVAYMGGFSPWPDGGVPQRLEVRIESRAPSAVSATRMETVATVMDEGAKANGNASVGSIVTTPPEPIGDMPLLIEGTPGAARLEMDVDANGKVTAIRVEKSTLAPATEQEMIERMRAVRFRPGLENGKPVASRLALEIKVESAGR